MPIDCPDLHPPEHVVTVRDARLAESSGVDASATREGVYYTHNDSGAGPAYWAFTLDGAVTRHPVVGARNKDWEDLAVGPCPQQDGSCVWLADVGDNRKERSSVQVYAVPEDSDGTRYAHFELSYPDGARNVETLLVHPTRSQVLLVTKESDGQSEIYALPAQPGVGALTKVGAVTLSGDSKSHRKVTAGDWAPTGDAVVLRSYVEAWVYADRDEGWWTSTPCRVPLPVEEQGEAISWTEEGFLTTSEGVPMEVSRVRIARPSASPP